MKRFLTKRNIVIGVVIVVVGLIWRGQSAAKQQAAQSVRRIEVERGEVKRTLQISGEIKATKTATLNYSASGKAAYIGVSEGSRVTKGQVLAYMDQTELGIAERKAYYGYLAADAYAKLIEDQVKGHDGDETFSQKNARVAAQTARDAAYDTWLSAQRARRESRLVAPFAGVVTVITATTVGDTVSVADSITVIDPEDLYFQAEIDEADVGKLTADKPVSIELDAYPKMLFGATVGEIGYVAGLSSTGATVYSVKLKLAADNLPTVRTGMNGDAEIVLEIKSGVLKLPIEAVVDGKVTLDGPEGKQVEVETGLEGDTDMEIVSGLSEGDRVVLP